MDLGAKTGTADTFTRRMPFLQQFACFAQFPRMDEKGGEAVLFQMIELEITLRWIARIDLNSLRTDRAIIQQVM